MLDPEPVAGPFHVRRPRLGEPLVDAVWPPVLGALPQPVRSEEEDGTGPGELRAAAEILAVSNPDGGGMPELVAVMSVHGAADLRVTGHVHVDGSFTVERSDLLVGHDGVVDAERLGELDVPGGRQADHLDAVALVEQVGEGGGGPA